METHCSHCWLTAQQPGHSPPLPPSRRMVSLFSHRQAFSEAGQTSGEINKWDLTCQGGAAHHTPTPALCRPGEWPRPTTAPWLTPWEGQRAFCSKHLPLPRLALLGGLGPSHHSHSSPSPSGNKDTPSNRSAPHFVTFSDFPPLRQEMWSTGGTSL